MNIEEHDAINEALVKQLLNGDGEGNNDNVAGDELITRNIGLVKATVRRILRLWPSQRHLRQDLVGEGLLILTQLVRQMTTLPLSCFRNQVIGALRLHFFKTFVRHEQPFYASISAETPVEDQYLNICPSLRQFEDRDFLLSRCENERECAVIMGYLSGFYQREVAEQLGISQQRVDSIFQGYKKRLRAQVVEEFELP